LPDDVANAKRAPIEHQVIERVDQRPPRPDYSSIFAHR
jgi:hypothetical protein